MPDHAAFVQPPMDSILDKPEHVKACIRTKVERQFRIINRPFGHM